MKTKLNTANINNIKDEYKAFIASLRPAEVEQINNQLKAKQAELNSIVEEKSASVEDASFIVAQAKEDLDKLKEELTEANKKLADAKANYNNNLSSLASGSQMMQTAIARKASNLNATEEEQNNMINSMLKGEKKTVKNTEKTKNKLSNEVDVAQKEVENKTEKVKEAQSKYDEALNSQAEIEKEFKKVKSTKEYKAIAAEAKALQEKADSITKSTASDDNLNNFKSFMAKNGLSIKNAEGIYNFIKDEKNNLPKIENFKIRKTHDKRDFGVKKVLIPSMIIGGAVAGVFAAFLASNLPAGSTFLGLTMTGKTLVDVASLAIPSALVGAGLTAGIVVGKDKATKRHYKKAYGNTKTEFKGVGVDNDIYKLMNMIEASKEKLLELRHGSAFTALSRAIKRKIINSNNRNRVHAIEARTKEIVKEYSKVMKSSMSEQAKHSKMEKLDKVLFHIKNFIIAEIQSSKLDALLNNQSNTPTIENIDIWANLLTYFKDAGASRKQYKKLKASANLKKSNADLLLNGDGVNTLFNEINSKIAEVRPEQIYLPLKEEKKAENENVKSNAKTVTFNKNSSVVATEQYGKRKIIVRHIGDNYVYTYTIDGGTYKKAFDATKFSLEDVIKAAKKSIDSDLKNNKNSNVISL